MHGETLKNIFWHFICTYDSTVRANMMTLYGH